MHAEPSVERDALIESGMNAAGGCFRTFVKGQSLPASIDYDDLRAVCYEALTKAAASYDPARGTAFVPYAWNRMWGAMLDQLRAVDWLPRSLRVRIKKMQSAARKVEMQLGRPPTPDEICAAAGIDRREYDELMDADRKSRVLSLHHIESRPDEDILVELGDKVAAPGDPYERAELLDLFRRAWGKLTDRERYILLETIVHERDGRDVAAELGVTESRVSQIGTGAAKKLRVAVRAV